MFHQFTGKQSRERRDQREIVPILQPLYRGVQRELIGGRSQHTPERGRLAQAFAAYLGGQHRYCANWTALIVATRQLSNAIQASPVACSGRAAEDAARREPSTQPVADTCEHGAALNEVCMR